MKARRHIGAALGSAAWVRPAAFDRHVVHLRLADDSIVPAIDQLHEWVERIASDGAVKRIRTSALFPRPASRFREAGFTVADTLALLRAELDDAMVRANIERRPASSTAATGALRQHELATAARIDRAAFGAEWSHDAAEIDEIRYATPHCRVRARYHRRGLVHRDVLAFAVSGASSDHGYLQRLSVDPTQQHQGHGRALTIDALRWMARRRLQDCLVNTSVENEAALGLYQSVGFRRLNDHLEVLEFDVQNGA